MSKFDAKITIDLSVRDGAAGVDELEVSPRLPPEIAKLPVESQLIALNGCVRALSRMGLHLMEANGLKPSNVELSESSAE